MFEGKRETDQGAVIVARSGDGDDAAEHGLGDECAKCRAPVKRLSKGIRVDS